MHRLKRMTAAEVQIKVATAPSTIASGVANTPPKAVVSPRGAVSPKSIISLNSADIGTRRSICDR